ARASPSCHEEFLCTPAPGYPWRAPAWHTGARGLFPHWALILANTMGNIRIIGIDPGLRRTGWGVIDYDGVRLGFVACGSVEADQAESLGVRLRQLFDGLS